MHNSDPDRQGSERRSLRRWAPVALLAVIVAVSSLTTIDRYASEEYEALFQRALITFALARTLNGVISAVQGTELALQPAGVGLTLTPGEILDPVNDLVERFSWIMLGATLSLGIQQVLLEVGQWWGMRLLVVVLAVAWLWLRFKSARRHSPDFATARRLLFRSLIVVLFLRFAVPFVMIANDGLYELFLEPRYVESTQVIESAGSEIEKLGKQTMEPEEEVNGSLFESLGRTLQNTRESLDVGKRLEHIQSRAAQVVEHLIQLSVVFILQTGILPIAFLWIMLHLLRRLFGARAGA